MVNINTLHNIIESSAVPQTTDMMIQRALDEATYYGKNEQLIQCEKIIQKMIDIGHKDGQMTQDFANCQYELANKLANIFGFSELSFNSSIVTYFPGMLLSSTSPGGCTLCQAVILKYTKIAAGKASGSGTTRVIDFDRNHKGIVFKPGSNYVMRMYLGMDLFMDYGDNSMTAQEIMAVILHEIGHNFYVGPVRELSKYAFMLLDISDLSSLIHSIVFMEGVLPVTAEIDKVIPADIKKITAQIVNTLGWALQPIWNMRRLLSAYNSFAATLGLIAGTLYIKIDYMVVNAVRAGFNYDSEKYSDAFATAYGYGPELSTALAKLSRVKFKFTSKNKSIDNALNFLYEICVLPLDIIFCLTDEHPNNQARLMNDIKYLEACSRSIDNPVIRKQYEQDIKRIYALRDDVKNMRTDNTSISDAASAMIQDLVNISDPREFFSALHPKFTKYYNLDTTV